MLFNLLHFLSGCVDFSAENGFPERFINMCTAEEISLWSISKRKNTVFARTTVSGYKRIRRAARASGMRLKIQKKVGLPFLINKYESHSGLLIGLVAVVLVLSLMSNHIWVINVNGNVTVSDEKIEQVFHDAGLKIGIRKNKFSASNINSDAVLGIGELSWASINVDGAVAEIEVREVIKRPTVEKSSGTSNIVARKDGQIEIIEPYNGSAAVKNGQTVLCGELLVSGITQVKNGMSVFTDAQGYAVARTKIELEVPIERERTVLKSKIQKIYSVYFLGKELGFSKRKNQETLYQHQARLYVHGVKMPFGINYTQYTDFERETESFSQEYAELLALNDYALKSYGETLHAQIISQKVSINNGKVVGEYSCFENICERKAFVVEETEQ